MTSAYPFQTEEKSKEQSTEKQDKFAGIWNTLKTRDNKKMLQDLSGT
jgi:hypothetical protein